jgi:hypothetical protein
LDQILRLLFTADTRQAVSGVKQMTDELQKQREAWKASIYQERARAAAARVGIAEQILEEKKLQAEKNATGKNQLAVAIAEERLNATRARAAIAQRQYDLRLREQAQVGVSGLDRLAGLVGAGLPAKFQGLRTVTESVLGVSLTQGLTASTLAIGGLVTAVGIGLVGAFKLAEASAQYLFSEIDKGIQRQVENISAAEPLVKSFGVGYDRADKEVRSTQERNAILGRDLPVSSQDINQIATGITDNLAKSLKAAGKGIDQLAAYQDFISSRAAIAANIAGVDSRQANLLINKLDAGASVGEVSQLEIIEKNPALRTAIEDTLKEFGVKTTKTLSEDKKADFIKRVFDQAVSAEQIKRLQGTVKAQVSSFTDRLFDPYVGVFGVERDLDLKKERVQSVFSSFSRTTELFLGEGGTLDQIAKIFGGTDFDVMRELRNAIEGFNGFLAELNNLLRNLNAAKDAISGIPLPGGDVGKLSRGLAQFSVNPIGTTFAVTEPINPLAPIGKGIDNFLYKATLGLFGRPSYAGFMPSNFAGMTIPMARNAAAGFMPIVDAISAERRNMPSGAQLLIANSSEAVFNQEQLRSLMGAVARPAANNAGRSLTVGNITIYQQPGQNAAAIVDEFLAILDQRLEIEQNLFLS